MVCGDGSSVHLVGKPQCKSSSSINSCGSTMAHVEESSLSKVVTLGITVGSADGDGDKVVGNECVV